MNLSKIFSLAAVALASIVAQAQPSFTKSFSPSSVAIGAPSKLTFVIDNRNGASNLVNPSFTDVLPVGMVVANDPDVSFDGAFDASGNNGRGGLINVTATPGSGQVELSTSGVIVPPGNVANVHVNVTAAPGAGASLANSVSLNVSGGGPIGPATATLNVLQGVTTFSKTFTPAAIAQGGRTKLVYTFDNSSNPNISYNPVFTDTLPQNIVIATPPNITFSGFSATPTLQAVPGTDKISLSQSPFPFISIAANAQATISVDVIGQAVGEFTSISGQLTTTGQFGFPQTFGGVATAKLTVVENEVLALTKSFVNDPVVPGGIAELQYTIINLSRSLSASSISFTDDLQSALAGVSISGLPANGVCGPGSTVSGTTSLSFSGGSLAPGEVCSFSVFVQLPANVEGNFLSTSSTITGNYNGAIVTGPAASDTLFIQSAPVLQMVINPDVVEQGGTTTLDFTITNTSATFAATDVAFTDNLTAFLSGVTATTLPPAGFCGPSSVIFVQDIGGSSTLSFSGGSLAPGASCSFSVGLTLPAGGTIGQFVNTTGAVTAVVDGVPVQGNSASDTLDVLPFIRLGKEFDAPANPGEVVEVIYRLELDQNATLNATGIAFSEDLDAVLPGLAPDGVVFPIADVCGIGSSLDYDAGTGVLSLTGGQLSPGASCDIMVPLLVPLSAFPGSYDLPTSTVTASFGGTSTTGPNATASLLVPGLEFTKEYLNASYDPGDTVTLRFRLSNAATSPAATGIVFTDQLSTTAFGQTTFTLSNPTPCGGTATLAGTFLIFSGGSLNPGEVCEFDVSYVLPTTGVDQGGYINSTSNLTASFNGTQTVLSPASDTLVINPPDLGDLPTVTLNQAAGQVDPTSIEPLLFTAVFSEPVTGFDNPATDVVVSGAPVSLAPVIVITEQAPLDGTVFQIAVSNLDPLASGEVTMEIPPVIAQSIATGLGNVASTSVDNMILVERKDVIPPVITLAGNAQITVECNTGPFIDPGASALDDEDGVVPVIVGGDVVDTSQTGIYQITYNATDAAGNTAIQVVRDVTVLDTTPPVISLLGDDPQTLSCNSPYVELGAVATDSCDTNLRPIEINASAVDPNTPGFYLVTYNAIDASDNIAATVIRTVIVVEDDAPPVITLLGDNPQVIECPSPYVEQGATAVDACDPNLGAVVVDASAVDVNSPGSYLVTYNISDAAGNAAVEVQRTVMVQDTTAPVITLIGSSTLDLECHGAPYIEEGATVTDACDPSVTVVIGGDVVDVNTPGVYVVTYNAVDSSNNAAIELTRTITVSDTTVPVITLLGDNPQFLECPSPYAELGATASDACDPILGNVVIDATGVNASIPGTYFVTYNINDATGNSAAEVQRTVIVQDTTAPVITLNGSPSVIIECQIDSYQEEGATVADTCDPNVAVVIGGDVVNAGVPGVYTVTYDATDASGNAAVQLTRTVTVQDTTPPVITLLGDNPQVIECPSPYFEQGATAVDACDPNLGAVVIDASAVDVNTPGSYLVTYNISDAEGNAAVEVQRTVVVQDTIAPVITLIGSSTLDLECHGAPYIEEGATVTDACDPSVTVVIGGDIVDVNTPGVYVVTYNAVDSSSNAAIELTRTITVSDTTAPVITLLGDNPQFLECPSPYAELGATASDACDPILGNVVIDATGVNASIPGTYFVTYNISDATGNAAVEVQRTVIVQDTTAPVITLNGASTVTLECHLDSYTEEGAVAIDTCDPSVSVIVGGDTVDINTPGHYVVTYDATDAEGNVAVQITRSVTVQDTTAPSITLLGDNPVVLETFESYVEPGATADDACHGDLTASIIIDDSEVDISTPGSYDVVYTVVDPAGNTTIKTRTVQVQDAIPPVITLIGDPSMVILQGDPYVEPGAIVFDETDPNVALVIGGDVVDTSVIGVYVVEYNATDASGNVAETQTRTVTVIPRFSAIDGLFGCLSIHLEDEAVVHGSLASSYQANLNKLTQVSGDIISVLGNVDIQRHSNVGGNIDAGGKVVIRRAVEVEMDVLAGGNIELKTYSRIKGDATAGGIVKINRTAGVDGVVSENQVIQPLTPIPLPVLDLSSAGNNVTVDKNQTVTLSPGAYKKLNAKKNTLVELVSGHYSFSEFTIDSGSELLLNLENGPVQIDVVGKLHMKGVNMVLWMGDARDVLFQVQGNSAKLDAHSANNGDFSGTYFGTYLVPNGLWTLDAGATLTGSAFAERIQLKKKAVVHPEPAIDLLVDVSSTWLDLEVCLPEKSDSKSKSSKSKSSSKGKSKSKSKS